MATVKTIKPKRLNAGDTIGIISPSQCVELSTEHKGGFEKGVKRLEELGFKVKIGKNAKEKYFYSAGTPQQRVDDLHEMFVDPNVQAVLMSIGGDIANELLPLLNFDLIKNNPKIFMGMSDGTTLLTPITDKTGLITFYGPDLIYSFGLQSDAKDFENQILKCVMEGKVEFRSLENLTTDEGIKIPNEWETIRKGKIEGQLIGGYLEIINSLVATGYLQNLNGRILYLESMEASNTLHTRLQYLKMLRVFDKIAGLILGYFLDLEKDPNYFRPIGDIVLELTDGKSFPILQVNELGHMVKNYAWPNGLSVDLDASNRKITALERCVK